MQMTAINRLLFHRKAIELIYLPLVHMAIPLSITYDSRAIIIPNKARYTQSSPSRANELRHIQDNKRMKRLDRLPNNSCDERGHVD